MNNITPLPFFNQVEILCSFFGGINIYNYSSCLFDLGVFLKTIMIVDGEIIRMNPFVSKIVSNTIIAVVNSLDLPKSDWKSLEVKVTK